jgi:PAS domain S-box-containing protein
MNAVLIVARETKVKETLQGLLKDSCMVHFAESHSQALHMLVSSPVDLIFMDSVPFGPGALEVMKSLKEKAPDAAVVLLTASRDKELLFEATKAGAWEVVSRPLEPGPLREILGRVLERQNLLKEIKFLRSQIRRTQTREPSGLLYEQRRPENHLLPGHSAWMSGIYYRELSRKLSRAIAHIFDLNKLSELVVESLLEIFGAGKIVLMLEDEKRNYYRPLAYLGYSEALMKKMQRAGFSNLTSWLAHRGQILKRADLATKVDIGEAPRIKAEMDLLECEMVIPLLARGRLLGFLALGSKLSGNEFYPEDLEILTMMANYMALAVENAVLYQEISLQKNYNENILRSIISGVIVVDKEGKITTFNKQAERILKLSASKVIGESIQRVGSVFGDIMFKALREGEVSIRQEILNPVNKAPLGISTSLLKDEEGQIMGAIMVFTDLSRLKKLEEQVRYLERQAFWSQLASSMAHRVRNPLVAIRTFVNLFPQKYQDEEFRSKFYNLVNMEVSRLNEIIEKLIEFAQPPELNIREEDVHLVLDEVLRLFERDFAAANIKVAKNYSDSINSVAMDSERIKEAMDNVVKNAIEAMPEGGTLTLSTYGLNSRSGATEDGDEFFQIQIEDTGCGISGEHLSEVFTPFFTTKTQGLGLGLSISQRIISDHGGSIQVSSVQNKGSKFSILLPKKKGR